MRLKALIFIYLIFIVALQQSCIEPYSPNIESEDINKYVVNGQITNEAGYHIVTVSIASPLAGPDNIPLGNCIVKIKDDEGNTFEMEEYKDGKYKVWMDLINLTPGTSYKLEIITPSLVVIESDFDQMPEISTVDSVYFIREDIPTDDPELTIEGIQFYVDYKGNNLTSRFIRWKLMETWEYNAEFPRENYYDNQMYHIDPPDSSTYTCWMTKTVPDIFTLSTNLLVDNQYTKFPLHYVNNRTHRLLFGYSLLVKQYGISENAYLYWDQLRINNSEQGGLYEHQPIQVTGNMKSKSNIEVEVLGFFNAVSITKKRIFVNPIEGLEIKYNDYCAPDSLDRDGWEYFRPFPVYFVIRDRRIGVLTSKYCYDCTAEGGVVLKPEFWPN